MNRLSQQESENEVKLFKMQGQIKQEEQKKDILEIQLTHQKEEARVNGVAEANQVKAFMQELETEVPNLQDRIKTWETLRKGDALQAISMGQANLVYTPNDVNLSIRSDHRK